MKKYYKNRFFISLIIIFIILALIIITFQYNPQLANSYIAAFTIVLAVATGFLAYFTWRSVRSVEERENQNKKERLLNEIIEWAEDVYKCGLSPFSSPKREEALSQEGTKSYLYEGLSGLLLEYDSINIRTEYISRIALTLGDDLQKAVNNLAENVRGRIKLIEKQMDILLGNKGDVSDMNELANIDIVKEWISTHNWPHGLSDNFKVNMYTIMMNRTALVDNAKQVIEDATSLKTEGIS